MRKEKDMFFEAYTFLEKHYDDTNFDKIAKELPYMSNKYKGSGLWQNLILAVIDHIEAKLKYEEKLKK